jgi:hypothetical protein
MVADLCEKAANIRSGKIPSIAVGQHFLVIQIYLNIPHNGSANISIFRFLKLVLRHTYFLGWRV